MTTKRAIFLTHLYYSSDPLFRVIITTNERTNLIKNKKSRNKSNRAGILSIINFVSNGTWYELVRTNILVFIQARGPAGCRDSRCQAHSGWQAGICQPDSPDSDSLAGSPAERPQADSVPGLTFLGIQVPARLASEMWHIRRIYGPAPGPASHGDAAGAHGPARPRGDWRP